MGEPRARTGPRGIPISECGVRVAPWASDLSLQFSAASLPLLPGIARTPPTTWTRRLTSQQRACTRSAPGIASTLAPTKAQTRRGRGFGPGVRPRATRAGPLRQRLRGPVAHATANTGRQPGPPLRAVAQPAGAAVNGGAEATDRRSLGLAVQPVRAVASRARRLRRLTRLEGPDALPHIREDTAAPALPHPEPAALY